MENKRMPSVVEQIRGVSYKPTDLHASLDKDSIALLRANNIEDGKIIFSDVVFVDRKCVSTNQILKKGDILICASSGSRNLVGKAASFSGDGDYTFGAFCKVVRPLYLEDADYIAMYFQSPIYRRLISEAAQGININNIRNEDIDALTVKWGSDDMRRQIVERLQTLQIIIQQRHEQLNILDQLIKARFVEMFGEETEHGVPLKECCIDVRGGGTPSMQHPEYYGGNVPFIKSGDVRGDIVSSGALWLTEKALEETTAKYVPQGSVLVVNRSAALLREFRAAIAARPVVINQDIKAFIPKHDYTSEYLLWAIKIQTQLLLTKVTTVLTSHIDLKELLELRIANVSIERQKEFSAFISQVDKSKMSVQNTIEQLETLKQLLMQKYFK